MKYNKCYCGLNYLWSSDEVRYICPARFNNEHSIEREHEHNARQQKKIETNRANAALGGAQRAKKLTSVKRSEIASKASRARWNRNLSRRQSIDMTYCYSCSGRMRENHHADPADDADHIATAEKEC